MGAVVSPTRSAVQAAAPSPLLAALQTKGIITAGQCVLRCDGACAVLAFTRPEDGASVVTRFYDIAGVGSHSTKPPISHDKLIAFEHAFEKIRIGDSAIHQNVTPTDIILTPVNVFVSHNNGKIRVFRRGSSDSESALITVCACVAPVPLGCRMEHGRGNGGSVI